VPTPLVHLEGVSLSYGARRVLRDLELAIPPGQVVGLAGPGAAGKTCLIKIIATLLAPSAGRVTLDGVSLAAARGESLREARRHIGMQFQNFALFDSLTAAENVSYPLLAGGAPRDATSRAAAQARAETLLAEVGLEGMGGLLPAALSGGMKRRVAVARALVASPRIALFDDPTAGLDPVNSARILQLITTRAAGPDRVVIIAGHDLDRLLPLAGRLVILREGAVAFDGPSGAAGEAGDPWVRAFVGREEDHGRAS